MEWGQGIVRRNMFESELTALKAQMRRAMPLLKTSFKGLKDFNRSRNWHKSDHATEMFAFKGRFHGAGNEEHPENKQKLGHEAFLKFSSRHGDLLPALTRHHSNMLIMPCTPMGRVLQRRPGHTRWTRSRLIGGLRTRRILQPSHAGPAVDADPRE